MISGWLKRNIQALIREEQGAYGLSEGKIMCAVPIAQRVNHTARNTKIMGLILGNKQNGLDVNLTLSL